MQVRWTPMGAYPAMMVFRRVVSREFPIDRLGAAATALATALVALQAAEFTKSTKKTAARGSLSLDMGLSVFAELKSQGLSFYRSVDRVRDWVTTVGSNGLRRSVVMAQAAPSPTTVQRCVVERPQSFLYGEPTLGRSIGTIPPGYLPTIPARVTGDRGRITLFDVEGSARRSWTNAQRSAWLHDGLMSLESCALQS